MSALAVGPVKDRFIRQSYCNKFKNSSARTRACQSEVGAYSLDGRKDLHLSMGALWALAHMPVCLSSQRCDADRISEQFRRSHPLAFDRSLTSGLPPPSGVLDHVSSLREEPSSDEGSTADDTKGPHARCVVRSRSAQAASEGSLTVGR